MQLRGRWVTDGVGDGSTKVGILNMRAVFSISLHYFRRPDFPGGWAYSIVGGVVFLVGDTHRTILLLNQQKIQP